MKTDSEIVDWTLDVLRIRDRATFSAIIEDGLTFLGYNCPDWEISAWYESWDHYPNRHRGRTKSGFKYIKDYNYVAYLNPDYTESPAEAGPSESS